MTGLGRITTVAALAVVLALGASAADLKGILIVRRQLLLRIDDNYFSLSTTITF